MANVTATYTGFAHTLQLREDGQEYHPGDEISLPDGILALLQRYSYTFDGVPAPALPAPEDVPDLPDGHAQPAKARAKARAQDAP